MLVNSKQLDDAAEEIIRRGRSQVIPKVGKLVNAAQMRTAARLLREAQPSVCNGIKEERPGFIESEQPDPNTLAFTVGILPSTTYRINRRGNVV